MFAAMRCLLLLGLLGLLALLLPGRASAQAWTQGRGHAYVKLSHSRTTAAEQYGFDGFRKPFADDVAGDAFFDRSVYFYGEYGLTGGLTLVGLVPYKHLTTRDAAFEYTTGGLGSVGLGLRLSLRPLLGWSQGRHAAALNMLLTLPTGYTRNYAPAIGTGQADAQGLLAYGVSFYPLPLYAQAGAGFRHRSGLYGLSRAVACQEGRDLHCTADARPHYGDEWLWAAEVGATLGGRVLVQALAQGVRSVQPPEVGFTPTSPLPTRQRYLKLGGGLTAYPHPRLGLSVQVFTTPAGRNTVRSTDVFVGLEYLHR